jgi:O-antigen/teichoic acid export membrane protein
VHCLRNILRRLFGDALGRDIVTLASGNAVAQILHLIALPILMLLYTPSDYGVYAVYLSAVAVLAVIAALRYDFAILVATSRRSVFSLLTLCTLMIGAWCALLALLSTGTAFLETLPPFAPISLRFIPFLPLGVGLNALYTVFLQYATRNEKYRTQRTARILSGFVTLLAQGVLFFLYRSPVGLILGEALGRFVGVLVLARLIVLDWRSCPARVTTRSIFVATRRYSRFPRYLVAMGFLSTISRNAPVTLFAFFFGTAVAGVYGLAQRLGGSPLTLLAQAVGSVFVGRLSSALRENVGDVRQIFRDVSLRLVIMALVSVAGIAAVAMVLPRILSDDWQAIRPMLILLIPSFFALFVASPVAPSLTLLNRQRLQLLWEVARFGAIPGCILVGVRLGLRFDEVLLSYSLALTCCLAVLYALCARSTNLFARSAS